MTSQEAESELVRRLVGAGVPVERGLHLEVRNLDGSHVRLAWQVFKEFAQTPVEDLTGEDDQVLFEGWRFRLWPGTWRTPLPPRIHASVRLLGGRRVRPHGAAALRILLYAIANPRGGTARFAVVLRPLVERILRTH